jgi:undecaprenyl-diphosphatase
MVMSPISIIERVRSARVPELRILLLLFFSAGALWIFEEIHENFVREGGRDIDTEILMKFRASADTTDPIGPPWVEELARDFTALGGVGVLVLVTVASALFLVLARHGRMALLIVTTTTGGLVITQALKAGFARPRPDLRLHEVYAYTASFPSGHAAMSAITYLTIGALIARELSSFRLKAFTMLVAVAITLLVGLSRIYLGVHWPSDVLGGWSVAAGWSLLCWAGASWFEKRPPRK